MRRISTAGLAALLLVLGATSALAVSEKDPEDVAGRLDIVKVKFVKKKQMGSLTIETQNKWACRYLRPGQKTYLRWLFDDGGNGTNDLIGDFVCRSGTLVFELHSDDNQYEPLFPTRPDKRTVEVTMPLDLAELGSQTLRLVARSKDGEADSCDPACKDRAPDKGRMKAY
jgi:hypothetical protein